MADSALSTLYAELRQMLGLYANWGITPGNWTTQQNTLGELLIKEAVQQAYVPPPTALFPRSHQWSFLHPATSLDLWADISAIATSRVYGAPNTTIQVASATFYGNMVGKNVVFTASGNSYPIVTYTNTTTILVTGDASAEGTAFTIEADGNYDAPDAFAGIFGAFMTFNESNIDARIRVVSDGILLAKRAATDQSGRPQFVAFRAKSNTGLTEQRWELLFWPEPDIHYSASFREIIAAGSVTNSLAYHLGGAPHSRMLKQSLRAVAEHNLNGKPGDEYAAFERDLNASILFDLQSNRVSNRGENRDDSDGGMRDTRSRIQGNVTYNGVTE